MPEPNKDNRLRSAIQDSLTVIRKLAPLCQSVDDMVGMLELAITNEGQLQVLADLIMPLELRMKRSA